MSTTHTATQQTASPESEFTEWMKRHGVTIRFDPAGIDSADPARLQFKYRGVVACKGKRESFDYPGGILAFLSPEKRQAFLAKHERQDKVNPGTRPGLAKRILTGSTPDRNKSHADVLRAWDAAIVDLYYNFSEPDASGLLDALKLDSDALDYDFPEWAENLGYDPDSRKAEGIWNACRDNSRRLKSLVGASAFQELLELESL